MMYLRGLENLLGDLASNLDFVGDLLDHCMEHSLAPSRELVEMGVDGIITNRPDRLTMLPENG